MTRILIPLLVLMAVLQLFTACEENANDNVEYSDWQARNAQYFSEKLAQARQAVNAAKAAYGADWEAHCDWRIYRTYALTDDAAATAADSICVQVLQRGTGSGYPLYTDSVRVNYIGRLIPNPLAEEETARTQGRIFDHSGLSRDSADVFDPDFSQPTMLLVSNNVEGFSTALMHMRIGDMWRIYIPQEMGYGAQSVSIIPAYSTLVFDVQLKAFYRAGVIPGTWD